jgi:hypothetical protein
MTNTNIHIASEPSALTDAIVSVLTTAMIVLVGLLSFAQFVAVV